MRSLLILATAIAIVITLSNVLDWTLWASLAAAIIAGAIVGAIENVLDR